MKALLHVAVIFLFASTSTAAQPTTQPVAGDRTPSGFVWATDMGPMGSAKAPLILLPEDDQAVLALELPADPMAQLWLRFCFGQSGNSPLRFITDSFTVKDGVAELIYHRMSPDPGPPATPIYYSQGFPLGRPAPGRYVLRVIESGKVVMERKWMVVEKSGATTQPAATKHIPFDTHDGYFVSNKFEPNTPTSFVVLRDQKAFDDVFGVAMVMGDKSHRLPPEAFDAKMVVAAIHRGKAFWGYKVASVTAEGKTLIVRYTTQSTPHPTAEFACPLIVSLDKDGYTAVQFVEDGKVMKKVELGGQTLISQIRKDLPSGWQCRVVQQDGAKGHPHGLAEPLLRVDFSAPEQSFQSPIGGRRDRVSPLIQLYFYDIATKAHVLEVIDKERVYSWDIPIYFGETEDYIIVTSPSYVNHGIFTEEAQKTIRPMWNVLRKHIENKGSSGNSVDTILNSNG